VGMEATGSMQWFVNLMEEVGIECLVGHPAEIRAAEPRKQKHDRRDADLILKVLVENRFRRSGCLRRSYKICGPCFRLIRLPASLEEEGVE
jgi:transposase